MNKILKILITIFILSGCSYEPILLKKNYNFKFEKIESKGEISINEDIKNSLSEQTNNENANKYDLYFSSKKKREIVSSNRKGDPSIYKISIEINYSLTSNGQVVLQNEISKQATYNNIDDKFDLLNYEKNIIKNLSQRFAEDILISITTLEK